MALTNSIPSGLKKQGFFFTFIAYKKSKKGFFQKNLVIEQCSSSQDYIVKLIKGAEQSLLGSV
jgi:hypothetical protein